jgi:hypothetical protein
MQRSSTNAARKYLEAMQLFSANATIQYLCNFSKASVGPKAAVAIGSLQLDIASQTVRSYDLLAMHHKLGNVGLSTSSFALVVRWYTARSQQYFARH